MFFVSPARVFVLAAMMLSLLPAAAVAGSSVFQVVAQNAVADVRHREVHFTLTFNQTPDFFTVDSRDRPHDAFQYWYDSQPGGFDFAGEDVVVIRAPEIHVAAQIP